MNMREWSIGVIGGGTVGKATARTYVEYVKEVRIYDIIPELKTHPLPETIDSDFIFVCLPTPTKEGRLDLSYLESFFNQCRRNSRVWVLRSTVPIGTTHLFRSRFELPNLLHSPEFLTARCATVDAHIPARNLIGDQTEWPFWTSAGQKLARLYQGRFPSTPLYYMTSNETEAVKLFTNAFFAVKVSFFNEIQALANKLGLNWGRVLQAVLADGRIAKSHTQVPGPDGEYGFGGDCLPKDLGQLISEMLAHNLIGSVCQGALHRNQFDRSRQY